MSSQSSSLAEVSLSIWWRLCPHNTAHTSLGNGWKAVVSISSQSTKRYIVHSHIALDEKGTLFWLSLCYKNTTSALNSFALKKSNKYSVKKVGRLCKFGDVQIRVSLFYLLFIYLDFFLQILSLFFKIGLLLTSKFY